VKIHHDVAFVSSVLFTIALLSLVPLSRQAFFAGHSVHVHEEADLCRQGELYAWGHVGEASIALILIGLIVTWTGYVKAVRSAWFIMFIIVWIWAYPLFFKFVTELRWRSLHEFISDALNGPGGARISLYAVAHFAPMVIALILPIKPFFFRGKTASDSAGSTSGTTIK
jgi:hypothetical protein